MREAIKSGGLYFALVFTAGFILGTLRVLFVAPRFGEAIAVTIEAPLMLAVSWVACGFVLRVSAVPQGSARVIMGATAFMLLSTAEAALAFALGRTLAQHLASYQTLAGVIGLGAQLVFASFPVLRRQVD